MSKKKTGGGYSKSKKRGKRVTEGAGADAFKGYGLAIGLGLGMLLGMVLENMTLGIIIGAVLGVGVGAFIDERNKRRTVEWKNRYKRK